MSAEKKSLTDPPKDLKEAIDWVIRINDHAQELGKALQELLKHDGGDVAVKVLDKYRLVSERVIQGLMSNKPSEPAHGFAVPHAILNKLSLGLEPFVAGSQANSPNVVENVGKWVSSVNDNTLQKLITDFADGLKKFVEKDSVILQDSNTSAYNSAPSWDSLTPNDKTDCASILLGIIPVLYIGLTYLYWQCEDKNGWAQESLNGSGNDQGGLKQYMEAFGYTENLNGKKGQNIVTLMNSMFSSELTQGKASKAYPEFLKALQDEALKPSFPNTTSPLTSLYALSYYYITNFLYIVEPTSPATPSFLGYSGTAALAGGAYGFNLGGIGTFMSALLA
ncbi:variant erythrocyte surface antigen-1 family protein [Babesia caballi]|uniref:Variant erythrocyte surface antigen-1 family protein n=1 Tax=Babesia caballi TaxID=5871 RepID=A0AAV4LNV0_BABCB|nr:variant erythrocyte surface antigen-1 family protein [Babesia caballi]